MLVMRQGRSPREGVREGCLVGPTTSVRRRQAGFDTAGKR